MARNLSKYLERKLPNLDYYTASTARKEWLKFRQDNGLKSATTLLTAPHAQPKASKNSTPTYVLHLAPAYATGDWNTCGWSSAGCRAACLNTAGRGRFDTVQRGRRLKTRFLAEHPEAFLRLLYHEIVLAVNRHGEILVRLNGTSDLRWEVFAPWLFSIEGAEFYDYTKAPKQARPWLPDTYRLTKSIDERMSDDDALDAVTHFGHAAVVVDTPAPNGGAAKLPLPTTWLGVQAWDGDETDDWRDRPGFTLLRAKGDALTDTSGFVRPTER
jgi:hypothetical protein